jgi:DNA-binding FadR family transcriptional regulator
MIGLPAKQRPRRLIEMNQYDEANQPTGIHAGVVNRIGRQIVGGELQPGDLLPEQGEFSRRLGVSRTVIREATKVLSAMGLVESRPKRGTVVTPRSSWRLLDPDVLAWQSEAGPSQAFLEAVFEVREIIEPASASLAAERASEDEVGAILAAWEAMGTDDGEAYLAADIEFHALLVSATHNDYLIQLAATFRPALQAAFQTALRDASWSRFLEKSLRQHRAVLDSVAAGDLEGAQRSMKLLVISSRQDVIDDPVHIPVSRSRR